MVTKVPALEKFMRAPQNVGANDPKPQPIFAGFQKPSVDMEAVRDGRRAPLLFIDIPLDNVFTVAAGNALVLPLSGNSFYIDQNPNIVGNATVHFQDTNLQQSSAPIYVGAGFIAKVPFTQLMIENSMAQAGKVLRLVYGTDVDFTAGVNATLTISSQSSISNSATSNFFNATTSNQVMFAANPIRKFVWVQNQSFTETMYLRFGGAATVGLGFKIPPDTIFTMDGNINTSSINIIGTGAATLHVMEG